MRILFISRAYPPIQGGLENQNRALSVWLARKAQVTTIANRHGKRFLPLFLPYATLKSLFLAPQYEVVLLGDSVLGIVGWILKKVSPGKRVVSVIHGLDVSYRNPFYQRWWIRTFLPSLDLLIAVSEETKRMAVQKNLAEERIVVIQNGVDPQSLEAPRNRKALEGLLGVHLTGQDVLLTAGRLVKRKGVVWFIREVFPRLPKNVFYVIAGAGPEKQAILQAVRASDAGHRIVLLGRVTDETRNLLLNSADLFIQPNIRVPGDMEGFGIAVIEAAACGLPAVASAIEGLRDAIRHQESGILVEPENAESFIQAISALLTDKQALRALGERARRMVAIHYHWQIIAKRYQEAFEKILPASHRAPSAAQR